MYVCVLSSFSRVWLFVTPWTIAHQAPLSMEFSMQEYWSGVPLPSLSRVLIWRENPPIRGSSACEPGLRRPNWRYRRVIFKQVVECTSTFHLCKSNYCCLVVYVRFVVTPWTVACQSPLSMEILQARILEWVAMPFFRGSSQPRDQTWVCLHLLHGQANSLPVETSEKP